jgi:hypothetical protein
LYTEVVFRDKASGADWPLTIVDLELPLYNDQEVGVICVDNIIVGFIDRQTNRYYYTTTKWTRAFRAGLPFSYVWITGICGGLTVYLLTGKAEPSPWVLLPLGILLVCYYVQRAVINYMIRQSLDRQISGG